MRLLKTGMVAVALVAAATTAPSAAEPDPIGLFVGRVEAMKSMKKSMATIGGALSRGNIEDPKQLMFPVKVLTMASKRVAHVFPEGSQHPESKAKPEVWTDKAGFEDHAAKAVAASQALEKAVGGGDVGQVGSAFKGMYAACKQCHDTYRVDKD